MIDTVTPTGPRAYDMSRYQRLIGVSDGPVTGTFKVSPPIRDGHTTVESHDVVLWDEYHNGGLVLHSDDMTCFVDDGVASLAYYNTDKEADILAAWPDIKLAVEAAAAVFPVPVPREGE